MSLHDLEVIGACLYLVLVAVYFGHAVFARAIGHALCRLGFHDDRARELEPLGGLRPHRIALRSTAPSMSTVAAPREATGAIPPVPVPSPAAPPVPNWFDWVERIHATPGRMSWPCPLAECEAVLPSAAFAAEHLMEWHGWSEYDIAAWWAK